jgi:hypothetical protein
MGLAVAGAEIVEMATPGKAGDGDRAEEAER